MKLLQQLGQLKNNSSALATVVNAGSFSRLNTSRDDLIFAFQRIKKEDTITAISNFSHTYTQFTLSLNGSYKRFDNKKTKILSASYQYDMKPWEFWILTTR